MSFCSGCVTGTLGPPSQMHARRNAAAANLNLKPALEVRYRTPCLLVGGDSDLYFIRHIMMKTFTNSDSGSRRQHSCQCLRNKQAN